MNEPNWSPIGDRAPLGEQLRERRQERGLSLRELARRIGVSASLISQIETDKAQPSVRTLYEMVTELDTSFDALFRQDRTKGLEGHWSGNRMAKSMGGHPAIPPVQRAEGRRVVQFAQGVRWESLTAVAVPGIEFLEIAYEPGSESSPVDLPQCHPGREWGFVVAGTLHVTVLDEDYVLEPGDAITYASDLPHRLWNPGDEIARAIWFVLGHSPRPPL